MDEVGNTPAMGEVLSWSESSAVVYANSGYWEQDAIVIPVSWTLMGSVAGHVCPASGLFLTDEGRKKPPGSLRSRPRKSEAQPLGSAIGMKVMADVPLYRRTGQMAGR